MKTRPDVMISSTSYDLPVHRKEALDAIQRQSMHTIRMEDLPASSRTALEVSWAMVDESEIYLAIIAFRYGSIDDTPRNPNKRSYTELEYERAFARGDAMERMIFIMSDKHDITGGDVEKGEGAVKLEAFKARLRKENIVLEFDSAADLRAKIIDSLSRSRFKTADAASTLHSNIDIPKPPAPYIAHAYALLQTDGLIGRQKELEKITDWATRATATPMLQIVAIGGMGKSALTWKWFNETAPKELTLKGRLWWSFYESDATWENFVIRALAYVSGKSREDIEKNVPAGEREDVLWGILDREPYLLALDGLERILIAYARADAARLQDGQVSDERALRKTADPRAGLFLRRLLKLNASRVLVSTRLFPAALEREDGGPMPGAARLDLLGLSDADAVELWRVFGVSGTREELTPLFTTFGHHPLLLQALAGEVKKDRRARGDFALWRRNNPGFDPARHPKLAERQAHILEYALVGLDDGERAVLHTIAAFRMPASQETLDALFVGEGKGFASPGAFDAALLDLEERGLVGWDAGANRYDLHPIVRGVVWNAVEDKARTAIFTTMEGHFSALPMPDRSNWRQVERLEDLTSAIQLFHTLVDLGRYDDAEILFYDRLADATLYRLSSARQRVEMLERLFPDGLHQLPRLNISRQQAFTLNALATSYVSAGQPAAAAPLFRRQIAIREAEGNKKSVSIGLCNLSNALRFSGALHDAEAAARRALLLTRETANALQEAISLQWLGLALAARGVGQDEAVGGGGVGSPVGAQYIAPLHRTSPHVTLQTPSPANPTDDLKAFHRAIAIFRRRNHQQGVGVNYAYLAQASLWRGDAGAARALADRAWDIASKRKNPRDAIRAARLQGAAAVGGMGEVRNGGEDAGGSGGRNPSLNPSPLRKLRGEGLPDESSGSPSLYTERGLGGEVDAGGRGMPRPYGDGGEDLSTLADYADERLHYALTKAREINLAQEELPALVALALLRRLQGRTEEARERLGEVWEGAERGPYPLFHADALNVLAQIERDAGKADAAIAAATKAYTLAWCDGISADGSECYAYVYGLRAARAHLEALGAPIPSLPPFSFDGREPMPEVEIDPDDQWHVGDRRVEEEDA
jgi:tetratricopeptide (TPR) repeat protein